MPIHRSQHATDKVKVAVIFEDGRPRPVWFQVADPKPVEISKICAIWYFNRGAARIITFKIWDSSEQFSLEYDTAAPTWSLGRTVIEG
jgi:hypothetical protein